ncbi:RHS repeat domain-containing protein [Chitinophaga sp. S165]|uniref:RHS repeat domain-containing protein n=1 Tax=Chitinophaga sp. S165 TaxID=2135462 RepID=UPI000D71B324|nr:RHS repeat domain-containing protein [Chitinophaga sp. S165]PWV56373.1 YD repeat-containing protein [Chitinophaga sp. S165]
MSCTTTFKRLLFLFAAFHSLHVYGQLAKFDLTAPTAVYKPSSNAAEMVRIADVPVSAYSGTPRIDFPLFTIRCGSLKHAINLNYNGGGGIPVEQEGNWVGMGWDLSVGGAISRSILGKPDETSATPGYTAAATQLKMPLWTDANPANWLNTITTCNKKDIGEGRTDMSPDLYYLNFDGQSAKLFFDKNGAPFFSPFKAWKISGSVANGFVITIENGTRYEFRTIESSSTSSETYPGDGISIVAGKSAWFLNRIVSANLRDTIGFNYTPVTYTFEDGLPSLSYYDLIEGQSHTPCGPKGSSMDIHRESTTMNYQTLNTYVLSSVVYNGGKVELTITADRQDVNSGNKYRVSALNIYTATGTTYTLYKRVNFNQAYTNSTAASPMLKRMLLSSFFEIGGTDTLKYRFTYISPEDLPSKRSFSQDHWGYYNGQHNNTLIPAYNDGLGVMLDGANREPDSASMQKGLLQTITYPTGGTATFEYEPHRYSYFNSTYQYSPTHKDSTVIITASAANTVGLSAIPARAADTLELVIPDIPGQVTAVTYFVKGRIAGDALAEVSIYDENRKLVAVAGDSHNQTLTLTGFSLSKGRKYYFIASRDQATEQARITVTYKKYNYYTAPVVYSKMAGGNRIKRITLYDGISHGNDIVKRYKYMLNDSISSGILLDYPKYEDISFTSYYCNSSTSIGEPATYKHGDLPYFTRHATSLIALGRTQGSVVGYSKVSVLSGEYAENGGEEFYYSITGLYDEGGNSYPYAPKVSKEDLRGILLGHKVFNNAGKVIRATNNEYNYNNTPGSPNYKWIWAAKVGIRKSDYTPVGTCPETSHWSFIPSMYKICQYWPVLKSKTDSLYDVNGNVQVTRTSYQYDAANLQMTNENFVASDQSTVSTTYKYPGSYAGVAVYDSMWARNMVSERIETIITRSNVQTYREKNNFSFFNGLITPSGKDIVHGDGTPEKRLDYIRYDADGNLLEQAKTNDVHEVYLWGYKNEYPVARVAGSTYAIVAAFVNQAVLQNPASDQALRDELNKIRTGLAGSIAQVITYTYAPQIGVTSETDAAGRTNFYEYDKLGRLISVKDTDGKIVRYIGYEYQKSGNQ